MSLSRSSSGNISCIKICAGILWNWMYSKKLPMTSFNFMCWLLSQYFLLHIKAAWNKHYSCTFSLESYTHFKILLTWNLVNSSARNSSLARMSLTTCSGRRVKDPIPRTSLPCSSTNSKTWTYKNYYFGYLIIV